MAKSRGSPEIARKLHNRRGFVNLVDKGFCICFIRSSKASRDVPQVGFRSAREDSPEPRDRR